MAELAAADRPPWIAARLARPARDLALSVRFYRDLLGLPVVGGFAAADDPDGFRDLGRLLE